MRASRAVRRTLAPALLLAGFSVASCSRARIIVSEEAARGEVAGTLFGYNLLWPAGAQGVLDPVTGAIRPAFVSAARTLGVRCLRHPGGTLSHLYHFDRAIGPLRERRPITNAFTKEEEEATFGTDEYLAFCSAVGAKPLVVVAYADGSPQEAAAWVAYLNGREGDPRPLGKDDKGRDWGTVGDWAGRRARSGHPEPRGVRLFEVGNETDLKRFGCPVSVYATRFREFSDAMRAVDPSIRVGAVGHAEALGRGASDPTDPWNETLLRQCGGRISFLAVHFYGPAEEQDDERLLAEPRRLRGEIEEIRRIALRVGLDPAPEIALTETNAGFHVKEGGFTAENSSPRAGLFDAAVWLEMANAGVDIAILHALAIEPIANPALAGWRDFGVLRREGENVQPTAVGEAMALLARGLAGGKWLRVKSPEGLLAVAARDPHGRIGLVVLSRSRQAPTRVDVDVSSLRGRRVRHTRFDAAGVRAVEPGEGSVEIQPFSLHLLEYETP